MVLTVRFFSQGVTRSRFLFCGGFLPMSQHWRGVCVGSTMQIWWVGSEGKYLPFLRVGELTPITVELVITLTASSLLLVGTLKFLYQYFQNSAFVKVLNWGLGSHEDQTAEMVLIWSSYYTKVLILKPNDWWSPGGGPIDSSFLKRFLLFSERGGSRPIQKILIRKKWDLLAYFAKKRGGSHPIYRDVIGDIIHYFTFMSSKLTLFALFSIFRHYSLFFQKYENNVITLYTFQNFRLFSTISAGEIGSQGSWPLASCSQLRASSRESVPK